MPPPTVSVILNCYNHEPYVAEAIESVLAQTFRDFELILIDNGSTDGSRKVLERYDDPRIRRFFHDENQSLSKRLNEGVGAARGEFVAVLYSDDWMLPDKLERQVTLFGTLGPEYGVVYCPVLGFNQHTGVTWQYASMAKQEVTLPTLLRHHYEGGVDMSSPLTRRDCFERYGWHDDLFTDGEGIFFRVAMHWKFHFDPHPTVVLRDHGANLSKAIPRNHELLLAMLDRLGAHPDFEVRWAKDLDSFRARTCITNAWSVLRADGNSQWARTQIGMAITANPAELFRPRALGGMLLATFPPFLRKIVNRIGNSLRPTPHISKLIEAETPSYARLP